MAAWGGGERERERGGERRGEERRGEEKRREEKRERERERDNIISSSAGSSCPTLREYFRARSTVRARRRASNSLLAQLAHVPILFVRHVPEFDRVFGLEIARSKASG